MTLPGLAIVTDPSVARVRNRHFDGLRGVLALLVVIEHMSALMPLGDWQIGTGLAAQIFSSFLNLPFRAGNLAVYIFFVLSGLVIAKAARGKPWPLTLLSRYGRLTIPMVFAGLMAWVLLLLFPDTLANIGTFKPNRWTQFIYQDGAPSFWSAISEPLFSAYFTHQLPYANPVLWTMRIELWGSFGIFTLSRFVPDEMRRKALAAVTALLFLTGLWSYLAFVVGAYLYDHRFGTQVSRRSSSNIVAIIGGLGIVAIAPLSALRYYSRIASQFVWFDVDLKDLMCVVGATLVTFGMIRSKAGRSFLMLSVPQFLGRISYSLYLTHMPILFTIFAFLYLQLGEPPRPLPLCGWAALFLASALSVGYLTTIFVDEPVTKLVRVRRRNSGKRNNGTIATPDSDGIQKVPA